MLFAQDETPSNIISGYETLTLTATDTLPDFEQKTSKLKVSGTIYKADGVTPAGNVILYIEQADEDGDFDLRTENNTRYVHHRGWVKTDANGQYTFYTFIPGNDRRYNQLQQLFPIIKEADKPAYPIGSFLFNDDPLLSKSCRKKIAKRDDITRIMTLKHVDGMYIAQKDIVLPGTTATTK